MLSPEAFPGKLHHKRSKFVLFSNNNRSSFKVWDFQSRTLHVITQTDSLRQTPFGILPYRTLAQLMAKADGWNDPLHLCQWLCGFPRGGQWMRLIASALIERSVQLPKRRRKSAKDAKINKIYRLCPPYTHKKLNKKSGRKL